MVCVVTRASERRIDSTHYDAGWVELYDAANDLNTILPVERKDESEMLMAFVREQNGGQGPGYRMLGILVRSSTVWTLAGGMLTLLAGSGISVIRGAEADTLTAGSFAA